MTSKGERTRAGIIECAKKLFYEHGYEGTSFSDIVEASGLYRGNITHYFRTKDDILKAVIEQHIQDFGTLLAQWEQDHPDPKVRLHTFVGMIIGRNADLVQYGCPVGSLNTELGKDRRDLQIVSRELFDLFRDWLAARFTELNYGNEARPLALHLLGRAQGIAVMVHVYRDAKLLKREADQLGAWIDQL